MSVTRSRGQSISAHPTECWFDIRSGSGVRRILLGGCAHGRLILRRCMKAEAIDLYWCGCGLSGGTFSPALHTVLQDCWRRLTGRDDACKVLRLKDGLYWIARLPVADYYFEQRDDDGEELYLLAKAWIRRPGRRL